MLLNYVNKQIKLIVFGIIILIQFQTTNCQSINKYIDNSIKVDSLNIPKDKEQLYFPIEMFPKIEEKRILTDSILKIETKVLDGVYDESTAKVYSLYLRAMKEPLLFNKKTNKEVYRFLWIRSFHSPVVIRIEKINSKYQLYWKVFNRHEWKIKSQNQKHLTEKEWNNFIQLTKKTNFWKMSLGKHRSGWDGSEWVLEGVNNSDYHVVTIFTPSKNEFYKTCNYLISLTNLKISKKERY